MEAVKNIDEILAVDGIDVFFIGPTDLSTSMAIRDRRTSRRSRQ